MEKSAERRKIVLLALALAVATGVLYLGAQNYPAATAEFDVAIELNPAEYNSYMGRGRIELQQSKYDAAVGDFARAAQVAATPEALFLLGNTFEKKGGLQRAIDAYKAALQVAPEFGEAKARLDALLASPGTSQ